MKLSIFLAGIRPQNWMNLYRSIPNSTTITDRELVIVSPYDLPRKLRNRSDVRLIRDWGCPTRCYQLGLLHSRGDYVVWGADDGVFSKTMAIDKAFDILPDHKGVVSFKYQEGSVNDEGNINRNTDEWWRLGRHKHHKRLPYIPNHYFLIMNALIKRSYFMETGGWDCRFEQLGMAGPDMSIRLQNDGAEVVMGEMFMSVTHEKGTQLHKPIEDAHKKNDMPLFKQIYTNKSSQSRARVDFDNWKHTPAVWSRRFK